MSHFIASSRNGILFSSKCPYADLWLTMKTSCPLNFANFKNSVNPEKTLYTRFGDYIGRWCFYLSLVFCGLAFYFTLKNRKSKTRL